MTPSSEAAEIAFEAEPEAAEVVSEAGPAAAEDNGTQHLAELTARLASVSELPPAASFVVFTEIQSALHTALADLSRT